jgi:uncharacterized membrane protein YidH (DUF202 family)
MISWQRTAVALIGFGFAIVEYFKQLQQISAARPAYFPRSRAFRACAYLVRRLDSRYFALAVLVDGSLSLG